MFAPFVCFRRRFLVLQGLCVMAPRYLGHPAATKRLLQLTGFSCYGTVRIGRAIRTFDTRAFGASRGLLTFTAPVRYAPGHVLKGAPMKARPLTDDDRARIARARFSTPSPTPQGVPANRIALVPKIVALLKTTNRPTCQACFRAPRNVFQKPYRKRMELRLVGDRLVWAHCSIIRPCDEARLRAFCEANGLTI